MARILLALLLSACTSATCFAQVSIYRNYSDLLADSPLEMEGYRLKAIEYRRKNPQLILVGEGLVERTVACAEIWGFRLDSALYRIEPQFKNPARVVLTGDPCYYENGGAHLKMYLEGSHEAYAVKGAGGYLSYDLKSEMTFVPIQIGEYGYKETKRFLQSRPEYGPILRCANKQLHAYMIRACITALRNGDLD